MYHLTYWFSREVEALVLAVDIQPFCHRESLYTLTFYPSVIQTRMSVYAALTARELSVLFWAAMGLTNTEIADALVISVSTVETHFQKIFTKLGVSTRTEAVVWAMVNGLITLKIHDCQEA